MPTKQLDINKAPDWLQFISSYYKWHRHLRQNFLKFMVVPYRKNHEVFINYLQILQRNYHLIKYRSKLFYVLVERVYILDLRTLIEKSVSKTVDVT